MIALSQSNGTVKGPVYINGEIRFYGIVTGGAVVKAGGRLELVGMINGNLVVERDGTAFIHGVVNGTIWNYGRVTIRGTVDAVENCTPDCQTAIEPAAKVTRMPNVKKGRPTGSKDRFQRSSHPRRAGSAIPGDSSEGC
jgi:hypothetical protein